jgi:hypothetical protein
LVRSASSRPARCVVQDYEKRTFQPDEAPLPLGAADLLRLSEKLQQAGERPAVISMEKFTVTPLGTLQRVISSVAKWFGIR